MLSMHPPARIYNILAGVNQVDFYSLFTVVFRKTLGY